MPRCKGGRFNLKNVQKTIDDDKRVVETAVGKRREVTKPVAMGKTAELEAPAKLILRCQFGCIQIFSSNQYLYQHYTFKVFCF
jgi:hypothetical protein